MNRSGRFPVPAFGRAFLRVLVLALVASVAPVRGASSAGETGSGEPKVLRYAMRVAETGFDPAQISDLYSSTLAANMFDALYEYEFLARPVRLRPNTATALPEASSDFKTFTIRVRPGIYFSDDPAFKGARRELVAEDYVYSIKRHFDPQNKSPTYTNLNNNRILGLDEVRQAALRDKKPFNYDAPVEGLRAIDRYTIQFKLGEPNPRFTDQLSDPARTGAVAREVVDFYGDKIMEHPVGTGPYRLAEWRRSSRIVFEKSPTYRDVFYAEEAPRDDPVAQAAAKRLAGRKMPMVDRVEVSVIEQPQPRWLAFVNREMDIIEQVPEDFTYTAIPNNRVAPNLAKQGIYEIRYLRNDASMSYFAMENPVVGGYSPAKVALRRAIALAVNVEEEIRVVRRGQAIPAQSIVAPGLWGYDPDFRSEMGTFDRARAKALLDLYGYVDRDGDGWREQPDGSPLVLRLACTPDQRQRAISELWRKQMAAVGLRIQFDIANWPDLLKMSRAGSMMMWSFTWVAESPDGGFYLGIAYGPNKGESNDSHFSLPAYDRLFERQKVLPDGPERDGLMREAKNILAAYMPYKAHSHTIVTDLVHHNVIGHLRHPFMRDLWRYMGVVAPPSR